MLGPSLGRGTLEEAPVFPLLRWRDFGSYIGTGRPKLPCLGSCMQTDFEEAPALPLRLRDFGSYIGPILVASSERRAQVVLVASKKRG